MLAAHYGVGDEVEVTVFGREPDVPVAKDLLLAVIAAVTLVLALGLRRGRPALAWCLVAVVVVAVILGVVDVLPTTYVPCLVVALGISAVVGVGSVASSRTSLLRFATVLVPLALVPYPDLQRWAYLWPLVIVAIVLAVVLAVVLALGLGPRDAPGPGGPALARSTLPVAVTGVVMFAVVGVGGWSATQTVGTRFFDPPPVPGFLHPGRVAFVDSEGATPADALAAAADAALGLARVPAAVHEVPGLDVLSPEVSAARQAALQRFDLAGRVELVRVTLAEHGLRPDAFREFLLAFAIDHPPTPEAALAGPLGPWLSRRLQATSDGQRVRSRLYWGEEEIVSAPSMRLPGQFRGPEVFAQREHDARLARLGLVVAAGAWLGALWTWLRARSLASAVLSALVGVVVQAAALTVAVAAGVLSVPWLLAPLLVVGAVATDAAAMKRAGTPRPAAVWLGCQLAPALVLGLSPVPEWQGVGVVLAAGAISSEVLVRWAVPTVEQSR